LGQGLRIFPKPCLKCKAIFTFRSEYCDNCRLEKKPREQKPRIETPERKARKRLLYNSEYKKRAWAIKQTATYCHLCQLPFTNRNEIQADHLIPGDPTSPLAAAHARCNASRGNKKLT
jgi:hypothetical protein